MTLTMRCKDFLHLRNYMYCKAFPKNHLLCQNKGIISDEKMKFKLQIILKMIEIPSDMFSFSKSNYIINCNFVWIFPKVSFINLSAKSYSLKFELAS